LNTSLIATYFSLYFKIIFFNNVSELSSSDHLAEALAVPVLTINKLIPSFEVIIASLSVLIAASVNG
jgi:hypothetical protein